MRDKMSAAARFARRARAAGAAGRAADGRAARAGAGAWPDKPVKIILPFGAGGVADVTSRILADKLDKKLGQRFVIDNMPGPGGINAARAVVNAVPDGYTLGLVTNGTAISVADFKHLPFDPVKQFEMISGLGQFNLLFAVAAKSPYKTLGDFIKAAKANPGKLNIGTVVVGSTQDLGAELFKSMTGLNIVIVPFRRSPDIVLSLLRNDVQMLIEFPPAIKGQVAAGKLRVLASSGRQARRPRCRTCRPSRRRACKGYLVSSWNGIFAPKGTPKEVVDTMGKAMNEILSQPGREGAIRQARRGSACELAGRADAAPQGRYQEVERGDRQGGHSAQVS